MNKIHELISELKKYKTGLFGKDFLLTWDKTHDELQAILLIAEILKDMRNKNISPRVFDSGLAIANFRYNSTRTRVSFASACNLLGLAVQDLDEVKSQIAHGETVRETANMISFLSDVIGIRDDMFLGKGHTYMLEVAIALNEGFKKKVLPSRPVIINLQCDIDHPTQSMSDLLHLKKYFGSLENLKGKKIAMTWAYSPSYGKPLSVPQGIIGLMTRFGMHVELAHPEGYDLIPEVLDIARKNARKSGGNFYVTNDIKKAFKNADIVYPKSWAPYTVMQKRTELLLKKNAAGLDELEKHCLENNAKYKHWECNADIIKLTKNGKALYMHCLPADISSVSCKEGEVSKAVFEKHRIPTYIEAGYKPYIIAAMIFSGIIKNVPEMLEEILKKSPMRKAQ
jgi:knotted carbamoyltransferase YgeW